MKAKEKGKSNSLAGKCKTTNSKYGRMNYSGVDMAFIHARGKRMLTMSEVARKLYPHWPRTTLTSRMKQMNIQNRLCTTREMQRVYSLNGIQKQGINCRLISEQDLDEFRAFYQVNNIKQIDSAGETTKDVQERKEKPSNGNKAGKVLQGTRLGYVSVMKGNTVCPTRKDSGVANKRTANKSNTRGPGRVSKTSMVSCSKTHVATEINKAAIKQRRHAVIKTVHSNRINHEKLMKSSSLIGRKRKDCVGSTNKLSKTSTVATPPIKKRRRRRDTSSPESSTSVDSGISSLTSAAPISNVTRVNKSVIFKSVNKTSTSKYKKQKAELSKLLRKNKGVKNDKKAKKEFGRVQNGQNAVMKRKKKASETITKEFVINMNLKHMNDKDLIDSFSKASSPITPERNDKTEAYCVKLMPVKPVWKVNSNFRFISNFLLPPSLVVKDGELKPACSMVCEPGLRPPVAHPIWKWKVGEPVIGNKTQISYKMKKIKCADSQNKK